MDLKFLTPTEMWEGYNPSAVPLEKSIISADTDANLVCSKQIFTADVTPQGRVRVYTEIYYDNRWADERAAILLLPHFVKRDLDEIVRKLVSEGYVVGIPDYCGALGDGVNSTLFPADLAYCAYPECKLKLDTVTDSARNTPWFEWTKIARRTISLLEEQHTVACGSIGVLGIGVGAHIAWQVAGTDKRVKALVPINGGGYRWAKGKPRFDSPNIPETDEERAFSTGVGAETYARFVTCPTFYICARMSQFNDADRAGDILGFVKTDKKQLLLTIGTDTQISRAAFETVLIWLRKCFSLTEGSAISPSMEFETIESKLYLHFHTSKKAEKSEVYISYGEPYSAARSWTSLKNLQKIGTHEYIANVPVYDPDEMIVAFATFTYSGGVIISVPLSGVVPARLGVKANEIIHEASRIIYDGRSDPRLFQPLNDDIILDDDIVHTATGPFDIEGITATKGNIALCRSAYNLKRLPNVSALHFDVYAKESGALTVEMVTYPNMKRYTSVAKLTGGEFWQKLYFVNTDFKSAEGKTLSGFSEAKIIVIRDAHKVICNNFLWI